MNITKRSILLFGLIIWCVALIHGSMINAQNIDTNFETTAQKAIIDAINQNKALKEIITQSNISTTNLKAQTETLNLLPLSSSALDVTFKSQFSQMSIAGIPAILWLVISFSGLLSFIMMIIIIIAWRRKVFKSNSSSQYYPHHIYRSHNRHGHHRHFL